MYKIANKPVAQGDILIQRIDILSDDIIKVEPESGQYVVAHSEKGGHHAIAVNPYTTFYRSANDNTVAYLVVNNAPETEEIELKHHRPFDTHESYGLSNGIFRIRRQMEGGLRGFAIVAD